MSRGLIGRGHPVEPRAVTRATSAIEVRPGDLLQAVVAQAAHAVAHAASAIWSAEARSIVSVRISSVTRHDLVEAEPALVAGAAAAAAAAGLVGLDVDVAS